MTSKKAAKKVARKVAAEPTKKGAATAAMNAFGVDEVCWLIGEGYSMTAIAMKVKVSIGSLLTWIEADPERSARVRETRAVMARYWDERSERVIEDASDEFELKKAKELSHHYRWRAAKIAPRDYGDRIQHADAEGNNLAPPQFIVMPVEPLKE